MSWAFTAALPLLVITVGLVCWSVASLGRSYARVVHTRQVLEHLNSVLVTLVDAETGQRGYLLTAEPEFLEPYHAARERLPRNLQTLSAITADNPAQRQSLDTLRDLVDRRVSLLATSVNLQQSGNGAEARQILRSGEGKRFMDAVRITIASMRAEEARLLDLRTSAQRRDTVLVVIGIIGTGLVALGLLWFLRHVARQDLARIRARETQLEEQARLLDLSTDAIIVRDPDDRIAYWNTGAEALYGFDRTDAIGRVTHDLLQTVMPMPLDHIRAHLHREGHWSGELVHRTKAGASIVTASRWVADPREDGSPRVILETNTDITERKRAETALEKLTEDLEQRVEQRTQELSEANAELEAFARSVAHDLRAPLRTMQGFSQALLEDYAAELSDDGQRFARRISAAAERMDRLILDLLSYARISRADVRLEPVDLRAVIESVQAELAADIAASQGSIDVHVGDQRVLAQRVLLQQVLANLISNAFKFVAPGQRPQVDVSAVASSGRVRVTVTDNGIGIAPEHQERVFNVFERLHGLETYPGTGIGLAIVRRSLERMGGRVGLDSLPGRGSRFWFELAAP